jgi:hypothetical protein
MMHIFRQWPFIHKKQTIRRVVSCLLPLCGSEVAALSASRIDFGFVNV